MNKYTCKYNNDINNISINKSLPIEVSDIIKEMTNSKHYSLFKGNTKMNYCELYNSYYDLDMDCIKCTMNYCNSHRKFYEKGLNCNNCTTYHNFNHMFCIICNERHEYNYDEEGYEEEITDHGLCNICSGCREQCDCTYCYNCSKNHIEGEIYCNKCGDCHQSYHDHCKICYSCHDNDDTGRLFCMDNIKWNTENNWELCNNCNKCHKNHIKYVYCKDCNTCSTFSHCSKCKSHHDENIDCFHEYCKKCDILHDTDYEHIYCNVCMRCFNKEHNWHYPILKN